MQVSRDRIRLQLANSPASQPQDVLRSAQPAAIIGNDLQFEVALFLDDQTFQQLADISDVATLTLDVKPLNSRRSLPVMSATLSSGDLNPSLTLDEWQTDDPAEYHALFTFENGLTQLALGNTQLDYWFTVYAWTNDSTPRKVTWGCGKITFIDDGSNTAAPSFVVSPTYVTLAQGNALWGAGNTGNKVNKTGDIMSGTLQFSGTGNYGVRLSNLTTTQRNALGGLAAGATIYNTTTSIPNFYNGSAWKGVVTTVNSQGPGDVSLTADNIPNGSTNLYMTNAGVLGQLLTGLTPASGTVTSADSILIAFNKLVNFAATGFLSSVSVGVASGDAAWLSVTNTVGPGSYAALIQTVAVNANKVFAGPTTGANANPVFRLLVAADIPNIAESQVTNLTTDLAALLKIDGSVAMTGQLTLVGGSPTGSQAVSASFVSSNYLALTGGTLTGTLNTAGVAVGSGSTITWSTAPTSGNQLTNKTYVDTKAALAGATFTGNVAFTGTTFAGAILNNLTDTQIAAISSPAAGSLVWNTVLSQVQVFNGTAWVPVGGGGGGGGGSTWLYGADTPNPAVGADGNYFLQTTNSEVLLKTAGTWSVIWTAPSVSALQLGGAQIPGNTMTGDIKFSSTTVAGLFANQLTAAQITALGVVNAGAYVYNSTADQVQTYLSGPNNWRQIITAQGGAMVGNLTFSGTTVAGLAVNNLTTTQLGALSSPATGSLARNTTTDSIQFYNGSAWFDVATGYVKNTGGIMSGNLSWTGTGGTIVINNVNNTQMASISPTYGMLVYNTNTNTVKVYSAAGNTWVDVGGSGTFLALSGGTLSGNLAFSGTAFVVGTTTTTNGNAAGCLGEIVTNVGSSISISNNTDTVLATITITKGIWLLTMNGAGFYSGTTFTDSTEMGLSATSSVSGAFVASYGGEAGSGITSESGMNCADIYVNTAASVAINAVVKAHFSAGTVFAGATVKAVRVG